MSGSLPRARPARTLVTSSPRAACLKQRFGEQQLKYLGIAHAFGDGLFRVDGGERIPQQSLGNRAWQELERHWKPRNQKSWLSTIFFPMAHSRLRHFCHSSTIWQKTYDEGIGAFPEHGFAAPLLGQLAEELRAALPAIFFGHDLFYLWAFRCCESQNGIRIHADPAAINVNFWITPDEAKSGRQYRRPDDLG